MKNESLVQHKEKVSKKENYLSDLENQKKELQNQVSINTDNVNDFLKKQEAEFKLNSVNEEIDKVQKHISELKQSGQLYIDMQKEITDFRNMHYNDSEHYNNEIQTKLNEIKEIEEKINIEEKKLIEEMLEYIKEAKEFLPESYRGDFGSENPERKLTEIANGIGFGGVKRPVLNRLKY
ncbi:Uncharacterised protein [Streptococcus pyogenes]|uniref:hypothetical protein n=1 Tax=Streptococcus pyogenes TaxID=1314 RepID=UPI0010A187CA|nr:hypothetical protein [Streptococcus pyogenes]VGQ21944.1 Uncharacterised protein [Streptococcus pyogenes]